MTVMVPGRWFMRSATILLLLALVGAIAGIVTGDQMAIGAGFIALAIMVPLSLLAPGYLAIRTPQVGTRAIRTAKTTAMLLFVLGASPFAFGGIEPVGFIGLAAMVAAVVMYAAIDIRGRRAVADGKELHYRGTLAVAFLVAFFLLMILPKFGCAC